jgi:hypothetical protein
MPLQILSIRIYHRKTICAIVLQNQSCLRHPCHQGHQIFSKMTIMPSSSTSNLTITGAAINASSRLHIGLIGSSLSMQPVGAELDHATPLPRRHVCRGGARSTPQPRPVAAGVEIARRPIAKAHGSRGGAHQCAVPRRPGSSSPGALALAARVELTRTTCHGGRSGARPCTAPWRPDSSSHSVLAIASGAAPEFQLTPMLEAPTEKLWRETKKTSTQARAELHGAAGGRRKSEGNLVFSQDNKHSSL